MSSKGFDTGSVAGNMTGPYNSACGSNGAGFLVAEGATKTSETTGWPDYGHAYHHPSSALFPRVGGTYDDGARVGLFYAYVRNHSVYSEFNYCARLSFRG